jgi:hypothetical protein
VAKKNEKIIVTPLDNSPYRTYYIGNRQIEKGVRDGRVKI